MNKKRKDPVVILLDIAIIVMVFVMLAAGIQLLFFMSMAKRSSSFTQDAQEMSFSLSRNDYASLIQAKYINEFNDNTKAGTYNALAEYVEALSLYKVYDKKGYEDRAQEQKMIMEKSRDEMGDLLMFADKADAMFGE